MSDQIPSKSVFESIFTHATMGILVTNGLGEIVLANHFALNEFGYERGELLGKRIETLIPTRFHGHHVQDRDTYHQNPETRGMGVGRDLYGLRKNGSEFPVEVSLSPFQSGTDTHVIAFIIDISVRKEKEESERTYRKKIADALISLRKEKELNDLKSRFVSLASHEFKTPLSTILSSASLLSKYTEENEQPSRDRHIERIKSAVRNLNGILNEFLSISKIENGKIDIHNTEFDIEFFISELCDEVADMKQVGQTIHYHHFGNRMVYLDKELLRNIVINLISNAIKFSKDDGVIEVYSRQFSGEITFSVKDTGIGMSEEDQTHLFERFYRGANALNIQGTGLGLHIVKKYVELMNGTIQFSSTLNSGSEIILTFRQ